MPKKRARDTNQLAAQIARIATGEEDEPPAPDPKAVKRGTARAAKLTPKRRSEIAKGAAAARWGKKET